MRLRIQTKPPLPDLKAWYSPPPQDLPSSIRELKQAICSQIPLLQTCGVSSSNLILLLDDFELLDINPLEVVRDGDLIFIKVTSGASVNDMTGHGKPSTHSRNVRRRTKRMHDRATQSQPPVEEHKPPKNSSESNTVPLGPQRARSTRARDGPAGDVAAALNNAFGSNADGGELTPGTDVNEDVVMATQPRISTTNEGGGPIMMATLRNKNKRKGFKAAMAAPLPRKIVFDAVASGSGSGASEEAVAEVLMAELPGPQAVVHVIQPRLVPPSEKQERGELPPRMFVTSVDVEEGLWDTSGRKKQKKQKNKEQEQEHWAYEDANYHDTNMEEDNTQLDYSEAPIAPKGALDWEHAEKKWDSFVEVTEMQQLTIGRLVGWKGLALNPFTFTPEVLISVATVIRLPEPNTECPFVVKQLSRPGGNPSFSSRLTGGLDETDMEEEEYTWSDILETKWRIVVL
ncbi:hypothetical protein H0H81_001338 [Sphagnurus paluster]|uniref:Uncharacterized protein n=1 Tax=Sphagnurus paluster TaxID=117069 RepID=A0A9P7GMA6_9AGAR|nr:hypothetical protein H0H81_001338 [Sphagnurus paluster]